jgi:DME family drug/metabolite transporter
VLAVLAAQFQACYFTAVSLSSIGLATLVTIGTAPIVVTGVEVARGRARRGAPATAVLALLGLGLLVGLPEAGPDPLAATSGAAAAVLAGSGFAVMTLIAARPVPGLDPTVAAGVAFFAGGLLLGIPLAAAGALTVPTTAAGLGLLVLLATIPTALAYMAYFGGLRVGASAGTAAVLALVEPLTAAVLAAVVLGERIGLIGTVGALMLALAVLRAARAEGRPGDTVG